MLNENEQIGIFIRHAIPRLNIQDNIINFNDSSYIVLEEEVADEKFNEELTKVIELMEDIDFSDYVNAVIRTVNKPLNVEIKRENISEIVKYIKDNLTRGYILSPADGIEEKITLDNKNYFIYKIK